MAVRTGLWGSTLLTLVACHHPATPAPAATPAPGPQASADPAPVRAPEDSRSLAAPRTSDRPRAPVLTSLWSGTYYYADDGTRDRPPVSFSAELSLDDTALVGHVVEPNTFADSAQTELHAWIEGTMEEDGRMVFRKTYDNAAGLSHTVTYEGRLDPSHTRVEGRWSVRGKDGGAFVMSRRRAGLAMRAAQTALRTKK